MRSTINSYLEDYVRRGGETAFAHRRGLRLVRWSYRPEWVAAFFGCALRGAVVVPLDVESAPDFVARVQEQTRARLVLHSAETRAQAAALGPPAVALEI